MGGELPVEVADLFWEIDPSSIDLMAHRDYVLERVMIRGGWEAMKWLRRTYDREDVASFLVRKGSRLPSRELAYWATVTGVDVPVLRSPGGPGWARP